MNYFSGKILIGIAIGLVAGLFAFGVVFRKAPTVNLLGINSPAENPVDCTIKEETRTVQGTSLGNLLRDGAEVKILGNYYACNEAKREEIVEYDYLGNPIPIAKVVKGVPGDTFALKQITGGNSAPSAGSGQAGSPQGWNLLINGEVAKTSDGKPYLLDDRAYRTLSLYTKDYKGVIPPDAYLILGDLPGGSSDSTQFGLVGRADFLGKIEK